ncbi:transposase family protein [Sorangium sp. So ce887]|uniref:transposase family protein n=1 Tax=Sorangium sp. So ce887 TaxID=3133324 RepID=UPI003F63A201
MTLRRRDAEACCPDCGCGSNRIQSRYRRTLADLPCQGVPVRLQVQVRRFRCKQPNCQRAIFTERLPALAPPDARPCRSRRTKILCRSWPFFKSAALQPRLGSISRPPC